MINVWIRGCRLSRSSGRFWHLFYTCRELGAQDKSNYPFKRREQDECSKMQHAVWLIHSTTCLRTNTQHSLTHTWTAAPLIYKTSSLHIRQLKNTETISASVRSWQEQAASCAGTHVLSVCNVKTGEMMNSVQNGARAKEDTPAELSTKQPAPSSNQCPHITALCGKPRLYHTLHRCSICSTCRGEKPTA